MTHRQRTTGRWVLFLGKQQGEVYVSVPEIQAEELKHRLDVGEKLFPVGCSRRI